MKKRDIIGHWKLAWVNEHGQPRDPHEEKYLGVLNYTREGTMHAAVLSLRGKGEPLSGFAPGSIFEPICQFRAGFYFAYCGLYNFIPDPNNPLKGKLIHTVKGATFNSPPQNHREVEINSEGTLLIEKVLEDTPHQYWAWQRLSSD